MGLFVVTFFALLADYPQFQHRNNSCIFSKHIELHETIQVVLIFNTTRMFHKGGHYWGKRNLERERERESSFEEVYCIHISAGDIVLFTKWLAIQYILTRYLAEGFQFNV